MQLASASEAHCRSRNVHDRGIHSSRYQNQQGRDYASYSLNPNVQRDLIDFYEETTEHVNNDSSELNNSHETSSASHSSYRVSYPLEVAKLTNADFYKSLESKF
jgi:hypothetical protein